MKKNEEINDIRNLKFNITTDMNNMFIEILITRQMLQDGNKSMEEINLLKQHYEKLYNSFIEEFRKNNTEERDLYKSL